MRELRARQIDWATQIHHHFCFLPQSSLASPQVNPGSESMSLTVLALRVGLGAARAAAQSREDRRL